MPQLSALLLVVFLVHHAAVAQRPRFTVGLKAGVGLSGTNRKDFLENTPPLSVMTDQYRPRLTYAGGIRLNYRLLRRLHLTLDMEAQRLRDLRVRDWVFNAIGRNGFERFDYTSRYENQFNRVQVPLTLRFDLWAGEKSALYLRGGVQYARLWGGHTDYVFFSNIPTIYGESRSYAIPLDIPAKAPCTASELTPPVPAGSGSGSCPAPR